MAAKPRWLLEIPSILELLEASDAPVLDRAACERLFKVRRRRAIELMQHFGGYRSGNAVLIDRLDLIRRLQDFSAGPQFAQERARKQRLSERLIVLEKHRRAAAVQIPVRPEALDASVADLPAGVRFEPGKLTVLYTSVEDLLARLYELAQAAANDFDRFTDLANAPSLTGSG